MLYEVVQSFQIRLVIETPLRQVKVPKDFVKQVPGAIGEKVMLDIAGEIAWPRFRLRVVAKVFIYWVSVDEIVHCSLINISVEKVLLFERNTFQATEFFPHIQNKPQ